MSLTYYDYEAGLSDFADDLATAIKNTQAHYPSLSRSHHRYDDGDIAMIHERRGPGTDWEHIAYGYYLRFTLPSNTTVKFWIGKILFPSTQPPPHLVIGIWANGVNLQHIPDSIGGINSSQPPSGSERFWPLPAGSLAPYDDPPPAQWGSPYNGNSRNVGGIVRTLENLLAGCLAAIK